MISASRTQFHIERPWGQRPFSIVPGEGPSRGLLRDCTTSPPPALHSSTPGRTMSTTWWPTWPTSPRRRVPRGICILRLTTRRAGSPQEMAAIPCTRITMDTSCWLQCRVTIPPVLENISVLLQAGSPAASSRSSAATCPGVTRQGHAWDLQTDWDKMQVSPVPG